MSLQSASYWALTSSFFAFSSSSPLISDVFIEYYDIATDFWQLYNTADQLTQ